MLKQILEYNKQFVEDKLYTPFLTDRYPHKKLAILTCMDTRLVELLPAALGYKNGDIKVIKNAGGIISHPYGSVIRSLIIAIYELDVDTIWVIGHTDCGMENMNVESLLDKIHKRGVTHATLNEIADTGVDYNKWLGGFDSPQSAVLQTIEQICNHPLIPDDITIEGLVMDSTTGQLAHIKNRDL